MINTCVLYFSVASNSQINTNGLSVQVRNVLDVTCKIINVQLFVQL